MFHVDYELVHLEVFDGIVTILRLAPLGIVLEYAIIPTCSVPLLLLVHQTQQRRKGINTVTFSLGLLRILLLGDGRSQCWRQLHNNLFSCHLHLQHMPLSAFVHGLLDLFLCLPQALGKILSITDFLSNPNAVLRSEFFALHQSHLQSFCLPLFKPDCQAFRDAGTSALLDALNVSIVFSSIKPTIVGFFASLGQ
jgi:hypothetical protein